MCVLIEGLWLSQKGSHRLGKKSLGSTVEGLGFSGTQGFRVLGDVVDPRSPGTHIVGPWVTDSIKLYRALRTGTQYIIWASREFWGFWSTF